MTGFHVRMCCKGAICEDEHFDFRLLGFQNWEKEILVVYEPLHLLHSVIAMQFFFFKAESDSERRSLEQGTLGLKILCGMVIYI